MCPPDELEGRAGHDRLTTPGAGVRREGKPPASWWGLEPELEEALWTLRHAASRPILSRPDPHLLPMQIVED
ncbi:MAG: hypothetical protein IPK33_11035 [Gemmatimonadetes bacterium]|nr:hypothetical protein [Gemmatimonadota bacterium]